jgi:hypothetical protein
MLALLGETEREFNTHGKTKIRKRQYKYCYWYTRIHIAGDEAVHSG